MVMEVIMILCVLGLCFCWMIWVVFWINEEYGIVGGKVYVELYKD